MLRSNLELSIPLEQINLNGSLADLGIHSITFIKIQVSIEAEFGF
ncbi:acyl carrier protein [Paenibacillus sp. FSL M7-0420]